MSTRNTKTKSNKSRGKGKKQNRQQGHYEIDPPSTAISYRGPLKMLKGDRNNSDTETVTLHQVDDTFFISSAGGVLAPVLDMNPSSAEDWSNWSGNYTEYRLLGCRIEFKPTNKYTTVTVTKRPIFGAVSHGVTAPAVATYSQIVGLSSCRDLLLENNFQIDWRMTGTEEAQFRPVGSPTVVGHILFYANGLSNSTQYGMAIFYWTVQFRGRQ